MCLLKKNRMWKTVLKEIFLPEFCINCKKEGSYLCEDCIALIPLSDSFSFEKIFVAADYNHSIIKKLLRLVKNEPYAYSLCKNIAQIVHYSLLNSGISLKGKYLAYVPVKNMPFDHNKLIVKELIKLTGAENTPQKEVFLFNDIYSPGISVPQDTTLICFCGINQKFVDFNHG